MSQLLLLLHATLLLCPQVLLTPKVLLPPLVLLGPSSLPLQLGPQQWESLHGLCHALQQRQ